MSRVGAGTYRKWQGNVCSCVAGLELGRHGQERQCLVKSLECCAKQYDFLLEAVGCCVYTYVFFYSVINHVYITSQEMCYVLDGISFPMEHVYTAGEPERR